MATMPMQHQSTDMAWLGLAWHGFVIRINSMHEIRKSRIHFFLAAVATAAPANGKSTCTKRERDLFSPVVVEFHVANLLTSISSAVRLRFALDDRTSNYADVTIYDTSFASASSARALQERC